MLHQLGQLASTFQQGGRATTTHRRHRDVYDKTFTLEPSITKYIKEVAGYINATKDESRREELRKFFCNVQKDDEHLPTEAGLDGLETLLFYFSSSHADILAPPPNNDLSFPLSAYYISSSHNTYLSGNQLYGDASVDAYTNVSAWFMRILL